MSRDELDQALANYERLFDLLFRANKLPFSDVGRFALSLEYLPIRSQIDEFLTKWKGETHG